MKKIIMPLLFAVLCLSGMLLIQGCHKKAPNTPIMPTSTETATPTITTSKTNTQTYTATPSITPTYTATPTSTATQTVTQTITPDASSKAYGFEDNTQQGWGKNNSLGAASYVAVTDTTVFSGTYGLEVKCAYDLSNDRIGIKRSFTGYPVYLRNKTVDAKIFLTAEMAVVANTYMPELTLVGYDGTVYPAISPGTYFVAGWNSMSLSVPDTAEYEMIGEVRIALKNDMASTYSNFTFIDDISW